MSELVTFTPGTPIHLETLEGPETPPITAEVVSHDADGILVRLPVGPVVDDGMPVHLEVQHEAGLYSFQTRVNRHLDRDPRTLVLTLPEEIDVTQRRAHTRVTDTLSVSVILRDGERVSSISSATIDVSVGGLSLTSPQALSGPVTLIIAIPTPERPLPVRLRLDGEVRRTVPLGPLSYRVAIAFAELSPDEEHVLSQYLFRRMRELRRAKVAHS